MKPDVSEDDLGRERRSARAAVRVVLGLAIMGIGLLLIRPAVTTRTTPPRRSNNSRPTRDSLVLVSE